MNRWQLAFIVALGCIPVALSVLAVSLLEYRVARTGTDTYTFMTWNLALAWCPVGLGLTALAIHRAHGPGVALLPILALWLLFLPNSPYLVSDLIHVRMSGEATRNYDLTLLASFAAAGLALGSVALFLVHVILRERFGSLLAWTGVLAACGSSGAGVYLGRVLRLNSWDAITDPSLLPRIVVYRAHDPLGNPELFLVVGAFAALFLAVYLPLYWAASGLQAHSGAGPSVWPAR